MPRNLGTLEKEYTWAAVSVTAFPKQLAGLILILREQLFHVTPH